MERYKILGKIGEGAHGIVLKAKMVETGETVALKKVPLRSSEEGIPNTILREVKALQEIVHPNVVRLYEYFPQGMGFVLVFEYMLSDLSEILRNAQAALTESQIKSYMLMLLNGVAYCHENRIMHRDLKPANLLISSTGILKLADFGLARVHVEHDDVLSSHSSSNPTASTDEYKRQMDDGLSAATAVSSTTGWDREVLASYGSIPSAMQSKKTDEAAANGTKMPRRLYSHQVATRWYRAPELLYGARKYDVGVDLWAVGCIFGELLNHSPLFPGQNDIDQLYFVLRVLGTPTKDTWPEMIHLPDYNKITFDHSPGIPWEEVVPDAPIEAINLLRRFLVYRSELRISARDALLDPYFFTEPLPAHHSELPIPGRGVRENLDIDIAVDWNSLCKGHHTNEGGLVR